MPLAAFDSQLLDGPQQIEPHMVATAGFFGLYHEVQHLVVSLSERPVNTNALASASAFVFPVTVSNGDTARLSCEK